MIFFGSTGCPWSRWVFSAQGLRNAHTVWPNGVCEGSPAELCRFIKVTEQQGSREDTQQLKEHFCQLPTPDWTDLEY